MAWKLLQNDCNSGKFWRSPWICGWWLCNSGNIQCITMCKHSGMRFWQSVLCNQFPYFVFICSETVFKLSAIPTWNLLSTFLSLDLFHRMLFDRSFRLWFSMFVCCREGWPSFLSIASASLSLPLTYFDVSELFVGRTFCQSSCLWTIEICFWAPFCLPVVKILQCALLLIQILVILLCLLISCM